MTPRDTAPDLNPPIVIAMSIPSCPRPSVCVMYGALVPRAIAINDSLNQRVIHSENDPLYFRYSLLTIPYLTHSLEQDSDPASLVVPEGHSWQLSALTALRSVPNVPGGHGLQNCAPFKFWNVPRPHPLHSDDPSDPANVPASHIVHTAALVAPRSLENVPLGHFLHCAAPVWS